MKVVSSACTQLAKAIDIVTCGFPSDKKRNQGDEPIRMFLYEAASEAATNYREGLVDYKIFTMPGMSGSPLLARD